MSGVRSSWLAVSKKRACAPCASRTTALVWARSALAASSASACRAISALRVGGVACVSADGPAVEEHADAAEQEQHAERGSPAERLPALYLGARALRLALGAPDGARLRRAAEAV